jgi:hypothetical protein
MMDGTMMNKNTPTAVSSITHHPYVYDGKEKSLEAVASMGAVMNQKTNILLPAFTTSSIASSWEMSESVVPLWITIFPISVCAIVQSLVFEVGHC